MKRLSLIWIMLVCIMGCCDKPSEPPIPPEPPRLTFSENYIKAPYWQEMYIITDNVTGQEYLYTTVGGADAVAICPMIKTEAKAEAQ